MTHKIACQRGWLQHDDAGSVQQAAGIIVGQMQRHLRIGLTLLQAQGIVMIGKADIDFAARHRHDDTEFTGILACFRPHGLQPVARRGIAFEQSHRGDE